MKTAMGALVLLSLAASGADAQGGRNRNRGKDNSPSVGDAAPNFTLKYLGKKTEVELNKVIQKKKKPVVLIFGSLT